MKSKYIFIEGIQCGFPAKLHYISFKKWLLSCYENYIVQILASILNTQLETMYEVCITLLAGPRRFFATKQPSVNQHPLDDADTLCTLSSHTGSVDNKLGLVACSYNPATGKSGLEDDKDLTGC